MIDGQEQVEEVEQRQRGLGQPEEEQLVEAGDCYEDCDYDLDC